jgi:hypothetical protein
MGGFVAYVSNSGDESLRVGFVAAVLNTSIPPSYLCYVDRFHIIAHAVGCGAALRRTGMWLAEACV